MDELIATIATSFGENPDRVTEHVDEFVRCGGSRTGLAQALDTTGPRGYGYFRTLLKQERFLRIQDESVSEHVEWCRKRIERWYANTGEE